MKEREDEERSNASTPQSHTSEPREHHIFNEHYQNSEKSHKSNSNSSQASLNGTSEYISKYYSIRLN